MFYLLSALGMIGVAAAAVLFWQRGKPSLSLSLATGAAAWLLIQAAARMTARPSRVLFEWFVLATGAGVPALWIYMGVLAAVLECGIPYLLISRTRLQSASWNEGVAFGLGFGAAEAVYLGLSSLLPLAFPELVAEAPPRHFALVPLQLVERGLAMVLHVFVYALILYGVRTGQSRWIWLAAGSRALVAAFSSWGRLEYLQLESPIQWLVAMNALLGLFALAALFGVRWLRARFDAAGPPGTAQPAAAA